MRIEKIADIVVETKVGVKPILPATVEVTLTNGAKSNLKVEWGEVLEEQLQLPGKLIINGRITSQEYPSPLVEQRADPYLLKHHDGYYYFTGSYPLYDRIVLRRAKKIAELSTAEEVVIWNKHESGIMSEHIWAPELHYIENKWYIYFAAGEKEDVWAIRPYVLECTDENPLTGKWIEKGKININFPSFSLDATTFAHNGERYLIWAQKVKQDTISNLYIAKMSNPWTIEGEQVLLSTPEHDWEKQGFYVNEGPAVIKRNGFIFVAYSASATDDRYAIGLLSAKENADLLDFNSWKKSAEPVFATSEETNKFGPGHNSFTTTEDGSSDLIVYHARPYKEIVGNSLYDYNRHAYVQRVFWKENGEPYFGIPGFVLEGMKANVTVRIIVNE
ncbi:family 43 glycosylhydrolase [Caldibacillus lycopersici]|uniref:Family 43 glycosylhydrolase n=1 Tax=Perspicuibacillus lycopersici TaxID=1325689 RepID=A0AAE3IV28_9BACI|nr:family 43 glycosylhydrolase [Perspicuibacillus lycopersici]MCU9615128.1 family 43 glycosylhydrolase [Perspicuibacillus lycopersici]